MKNMKKTTRSTVFAAVIAALYVVLTYLQNFIIPDSATMAIQFRASEALCVLAFFTPAAIPGLAVGCFLFNLSYAGALPLDFVVGTAATILATAAMWAARNVKLGRLPVPGLLMPAVFNAIFVGWELSVYIGGGFWINALSVAIGEAVVLLTLGSLLYVAIRARKLDQKLFN